MSSDLGKAPFLESLRLLGVLVILSWITSLCAAVIAHRLIGDLFLTLYHFFAAVRHVEESLPIMREKFKNELKDAVDPVVVADRAHTMLDEEQEKFSMKVRVFEAKFFPTSDRTNRLMSVSLYSFVLGFFVLGISYVVWTFSA